jgi:hypothetical protein
LELKTSLGDKRRDGTRRLCLPRTALLQLVGYVLLDFPDEFKVREVGVYDARYAHLVRWPLDELLDELAGRLVELAAPREAFELLLRAGAYGESACLLATWLTSLSQLLTEQALSPSVATEPASRSCPVKRSASGGGQFSPAATGSFFTRRRHPRLLRAGLRRIHL